MDCLQVINLKNLLSLSQKDEDCSADKMRISQTEFVCESICQKALSESKIQESEDNSYCYPCFNKKIFQMKVRLQEQRKTQEQLKCELRQFLKNREEILLKQSKSEYLKVLQKQKQELQNELENARNQLKEGLKKQLDYKRGEKQKLEEFKMELQVITMINESELLSKRSKLRYIQADRVIKAYNLYEMNKSHPDYQISRLLEFTKFDFENFEDEHTSHNSELSKVLLKKHFFHEYSFEHTHIISFSFRNLFKLIEYIIRVKNFDMPFPFKLDKFQQPYIVCKNDGHEIILFQGNLIPIDNNFIYCWINYFILYKRLGLDFNQMVLAHNLIFPLDQLRDFFTQEKFSLTSQLSSTEYKPFINSNIEKLFKNELLNIKYSPNSFKKFSEEINYLGDNSELKIIILSEFEHDQIFSKIEDNESDLSDLDAGYEVIYQN